MCFKIVMNKIVDPDKKEYLLTNHVKLLHKVAIFWEGKVLLLKKPADDFTRPNGWDLAGGNSNWPESTEVLENPHYRDLAREIKEETGLIIDASLAEPVYLASGFDPAEIRYTILIGYRFDLSRPPSRIRVSKSEHQAFFWADPMQIVSGEFDFGVGGEFIEKIVIKAHRPG